MKAATTTKSKRRFLQFRLRSMLLVMLVLGLAFGWISERARKQREAVEWIRQQPRGNVTYDYEREARERDIDDPRPPAPDWLVDRLGIDFFATVVSARVRTDARDLSPVAGLTDLENLNLEISHATDLSPLAELKNLKGLQLTGDRAKDLSPLAELKGLEELYVEAPRVSDLSPLEGLRQLKVLTLSEMELGDAPRLTGLPELDSLHVDGMQVSDLSFLAELHSVTYVNIYNTSVTDVSPLAAWRISSACISTIHRSPILLRSPN